MAKGIYVGANTTEKLIEFTSSLVPTTWTNSSNRKTATATNDYGEWEIGTNYVDTTDKVSNMFDNNASTHWDGKSSGSGTYNYTIYLRCPTNTFIKPSNITVSYTCFGDLAIWGLNADTGAYEEITMFSSPTSDKTETFNYTGSSYFSKIEMRGSNTKSNGNTPGIYDFTIKSGKLKNAAINNVAHKVTKAYVGVAEDSLVVNGDFSNGLEGWAVGSNLSAEVINENSENVLKITNITKSSAAWDNVTQAFNPISGHKYYISAYMKGASNNTTGSYGLYVLAFSICATPQVGVTTDTWTFVSTIESEADSQASFGTSIHLRIPNGTTDLVGNVSYFKNIKVYDLTAIFGAGNEPTQEWCDANLEEIKTLYRSKNSKARKVKKGYIGVGGVARLFFSSEPELSYYGTADSLSVARERLAATSVGDYALFGGGHGSGSTRCATVDTYTKSLVKSTATDLSTARQELAATSVGSYALFGGGYTTTYNSTVDAYNTNLTRSTATSLSKARYGLAATSVGDYALFGGGSTGNNSSVVDAYNTNLTRSTATALSFGRLYLAATSVGDYALFGGGSGNSNDAVDAYNSSLTRSTPTKLSAQRYYLAATSVGDYALFGGGTIGTKSAVVDTYTSTLIKGTATDLSVARENLAATTVGDYALFGGGYTDSSSNVVDTYDTNLLKSTTTVLSVAREHLVATTVGDYALFGGGYTNKNTSAVVDVYQLV